MNAGRGQEALAHLRAAAGLPDGMEAVADAFGIRLAMALAHLEAGALADAERCLAGARLGAGGEDALISSRSFAHAVRAELHLARGEVDEGLAAWRSVIGLLVARAGPPGAPAEPVLAPWALEVQSVAVVAHARHGRLGALAGTADDLAVMLRDLLTNPGRYAPTYLTGMPLCGALLLALAMVELDGARASGERAAAGARMVALAERFGYLRQFQPTMSQAAYDEAVATYAAMGPADLRAAALRAADDFRPGPGPAHHDGSRAKSLLDHT
jgi:hypothetical protein